MDVVVPETINFHIWPRCNLRCRYCFGSFPDRPRSLASRDWFRVLDESRSLGVRRANFSGGEPTLYPEIENVVRYARSIGLVTSIITNGKRLTDELLENLDLVGLSIDTEDDDVSRQLGRWDAFESSYRRHIERTAARVRAHGVNLKVNTVVCSANQHEDLNALYLRLDPAKIKLLQFVAVAGENDSEAASLAISDTAFEAFVRRHERVRDAGIWLEPEPASTIRATYVMVDPSGRLFQHQAGTHAHSRPVHAVGLLTALRDVGGYDRALFESRGGHIDVRALRRGTNR
jgi:radical S-adenosyl methionine domain-containing protein 2